MKTFFFLVITSLFAEPTLDHDIHLSVVRLEMEEPTHIDLTVQVFLDDLMNSVGLAPGEPLPDEYTNADDLLQKFVADHLHIIINDSPVKPTYLETFSSTPAVWITYRIDDVQAPIVSLEIENIMMLDLFDDQLNMIHLDIMDHVSAHALDAKNTSKRIIL